MAASGRSRNAPCFCGSERKLKHCCLRSLTPGRTWKGVDGRCRWRFWQARGAHERLASEVAEHLCTGERVWIARGSPAGTTWIIGQDAATLLEVLDRLPGALYEWVIKQTLSALHDSAPSEDHDPLPSPDSQEVRVLGEVHQLMLELLRLAHASDALEAHLPLNTTATQPASLTLHDRAWSQLAS
jgi:hypothetical protein